MRNETSENRAETELGPINRKKEKLASALSQIVTKARITQTFSYMSQLTYFYLSLFMWDFLSLTVKIALKSQLREDSYSKN